MVLITLYTNFYQRSWLFKRIFKSLFNKGIHFKKLQDCNVYKFDKLQINYKYFKFEEVKYFENILQICYSKRKCKFI